MDKGYERRHKVEAASPNWSQFRFYLPRPKFETIKKKKDKKGILPWTKDLKQLHLYLKEAADDRRMAHVTKESPKCLAGGTVLRHQIHRELCLPN